MPMKCTPAMLLAALLVVMSASAQGPHDRSMADEGLHAIVRHAGERRTPFTAAPQSPHQAAASASGGRLLFVSRGMPHAELVAALDAAAADPRLTLVLRGLLPGETLNDAMQALARLIGRRDPPPAIVIDPTLYRRHQVTVVPTLLDPATGSRREGAINAEDLAHADVPGFAATTWGIAEPDLALLLRSRAAALDVPARARAAMARFWRQVPALTLPRAETSRTRRFTPAVRTGSELRDDQGRLLLRAGAVLNPLATLPLTARILVLDAQDPAEIAWARTQRAANRATIHLAVNPDREGGWAAWQALQDQLQSPVFLLDAQLQGRLGVQATPSLIEVLGPELVVTETALSRQRMETRR
jgi:conjugal transfer pilus assembly protein TraW